MNHRPLSPDEQSCVASWLSNYERRDEAARRNQRGYTQDRLNRVIGKLRTSKIRKSEDAEDWLYMARVDRAFLLATQSA